MTVIQTRRVHVCDFCGRNEDQLSCIVASAKADICDECVDAAVEIVAEHRRAKRAEADPATPAIEA